MNNTLLQLNDGTAPTLAEWIEEHSVPPRESSSHIERDLCSSRFAKWEVLRLRVNTIGGREALDEAMRLPTKRRKRGSVLMDYIWFILGVCAIMALISRCDRPDDRKLHPSAPVPVQEKISWLEGGSSREP